MSSQGRFTISIQIKDNLSLDPPITMATSCDEALTISAREVDEMKLGAAIGVGVIGGMDTVVRLMKIREMRRDVLIAIAEQLAARLADRMADAEGWHDTGRVKPARQSINYKP